MTTDDASLCELQAVNSLPPAMQRTFDAETFARIPARELAGDSVAKPLVSVLMLAHNHAEFIGEAVESIMQQSSDFEFELIIGEDASKDHTRQICAELHKSDPRKIRLLYSDDNVGMHRNFARLWWRARGEFIAFCEGDDFWCDKQKLAKQVEFLRRDPGLNLCGAETKVVERDGSGQWVKVGTVRPPTKEATYDFRSLIPHYCFHFSSVMVRKSAVEFPYWFWDVYCVDRPLYLLAASSGDAGFIDEVMSVYRRHGGGAWSALSPAVRGDRSLKLFETMAAHFGPEHSRVFTYTLGSILWAYMAEALDAGRLNEARGLFWRSLARHAQVPHRLRLRLLLVAWLRLYVPRLYTVIKAAGTREA